MAPLERSVRSLVSLVSPPARAILAQVSCIQ